MFDILSAILYGDDLDLLGKRPLEAPRSTAEQEFFSHLQSLDPEMLRLLEKDAAVMLQERHDFAFRSGVCFGAQLAAQLMEGF